MGESSGANMPLAADGRYYHLHTRPGYLAPFCLLVGDPDRATLIAENFFEHIERTGDHRGLRWYTGIYRDVPVSVVTTGMGSPSLCVVVPEAYDSGARMFIRVGTCGSLIERSRPGDAIIVDRALRLESVSLNYAPADFPAAADPRVVAALVCAAERLHHKRYFVGTEATTDCFREGQGRPNTQGVLTERARQIHEQVLAAHAACYAMEASALFVWCATHWGGVPCGVVNAVICNRITNEFCVRGEKEAAHIALEAICALAHELPHPYETYT